MKNSKQLKKPVLLLSFLLTILSIGSLRAQDTLIYQNGDKRVIKMIEIGLDEVKFRNMNDSSDVVRVIEKTEVKEIRLANHETIRIATDPMDAQYSTKDLNKKQAVKINFLGPLFNQLSFSYEKVIIPWVNFEGEIGIIGVGFSTNSEDAGGYLVRGGVKFIRKPDFKIRGQKLAHPLHGKYFKPEFIFNHYSKKISYDEAVYLGPPSYGYQYTQHEEDFNYTNVAVVLNFGKQFYLNGGVVIDTYLGIGYGTQIINGESFRKYQTDDFDEGYDIIDTFPFTHAQGGPSFPISFTFGIKMGYAF